MRVPSPARVTTASIVGLGRGSLGGRPFRPDGRDARCRPVPGLDRGPAVDGTPLHGRLDHIAPRFEATAEVDEVVEDLANDLLEFPGPVITEGPEVLVERVVVVLLLLDPWVGGMLDGRGESELLRDARRRLRELVHRVRGIELVEDPVLAGRGRVLEREAEGL